MINIECVKTGYLAENCYVVGINEDCLVIDPGADFKKIKKAIAKRKVLGILITHYHFDHVGALDEMIKNYNVPIIDYGFTKEQKIGKFIFEIIKTPGHKEDEVTYYFREDKIMFVGDFIFNGNIGRCDLDGGNFGKMLNSLNKIKKYDRTITLYPGHGKKTNLGYEIDNNPYFKGDYNE